MNEDLDYIKDNFDELDCFLYGAAKEFNKPLHGSMTNFIGCSVREIKDIMHTTLSRIVPDKSLPEYIQKADKLIA